MPKRLAINHFSKTANYLSCTGDSVGYRFGFNGQEKDNEVTGIEGSHNTAEFWMYDTRLGRRWNVDPVDQVSVSNYACFGNNPILNVDPNGADSTTYIYSGKDKNGRLTFSKEQLQKIAENSEKIDRLNGISYTKYKVFESKEEFVNSVKNGDVKIDRYSDLVYEVSPEYELRNNQEWYGETMRGGVKIYDNLYLNGGTIFSGSVSYALGDGHLKYLFTNLGKVLAHERLIHGYGYIYEDIFDTDEFCDVGHTSGGLAKKTLMIRQTSYPNILSENEVLNESFKTMINNLHRISPMLRLNGLNPEESYANIPDFLEKYSRSELLKAKEQGMRSPLYRSLVFSVIIYKLYKN